MKLSAHRLTRLLSVWTFLFYSYTAFAAQTSDQVFILDASGSMWGQIEGVSKITIAREVMGGLIRKLPDDSQTGLVVYGHRRKGDCSDIETLFPLGPIDKAVLEKTINDLNPKGKTPITASVNQAIELVRTSERAATVILVSDGLETCGGDPCQAVKDARESGVNFVMHVVGFGIEDKDSVASLECAAQAGGGLYFDANNAGELSAALEQAVEQTPVITGGTLSIKAVANGKLTDVVITVTNSDTGEKAAGGRSYRSEETNPRRFLLPAGTYTATINALKFKGDTKRTIKDIVVVDGETSEHVIDFSSGKISIKVLTNGKLDDAVVNITPAGENTSVAGGRTYTSNAHNPAIYSLTPGIYTLTVSPVKFKGGKKTVFENITVKAGETHAETAEYATGIISVKVTENGQLSDATVNIRDADTKNSIDGGRTYTSDNHNPKRFELNTGKYDVRIKSVRIDGDSKYTFDNVELGKGQTVDLAHDYQTGTLVVTTRNGAELTDATINVIDSAGKSLGGSRSYGKAKEFYMFPGDYVIKSRAIKVEGSTPQEISVHVETGQTTKANVDFSAPKTE